MAERRMFSNNIINSAKFLMMPNEAQNLYFHLGMRADDDGVVEGFTVLRQTGINEDNLKILQMKGFVKVLNEEKVTFIMDWTEHNKLRAGRKKDSIYKNLLLEVCPQIELKQTKPRADRLINNGTSQGQPKDGVGKVSIGKDRLGEVSIVEDSKPIVQSKELNIPFETFWELYDKKTGKKKSEAKWNKLTNRDRVDIMEFIPKYKEYEPRKAWRKDPMTFFNNESWKDEIIDKKFNNKNNGTKKIKPTNWMDIVNNDNSKIESQPMEVEYID